MSYRVRYTKGAKEDIKRLYGFLLDHDVRVARRALDSIGKGMEFLCDFPFACRKVLDDDPFLRELLISFGDSGYIALFEIESKKTVTILAVRHQREEDYH